MQAHTFSGIVQRVDCPRVRYNPILDFVSHSPPDAVSEHNHDHQMREGRGSVAARCTRGAQHGQQRPLPLDGSEMVGQRASHCSPGHNCLLDFLYDISFLGVGFFLEVEFRELPPTRKKIIGNGRTRMFHKPSQTKLRTSES